MISKLSYLTMDEIKTKLTNPFLQAATVIGLFLLASGIAIVSGSLPNEPWTLAIAFQLLFILYNVIIGLVGSAQKYYWSFSILAYIILMVINAFLAGKISGLAMDNAGTYRWVYFIFCPIYLLFIVLTTLIKKIVGMAEKDDRSFDQ
jgi:hypothetical protein